jgi:hypothetical protein
VFRATGIILVGENRPSATASVHATKSGGRKPPVDALRHTHGGLTAMSVRELASRKCGAFSKRANCRDAVCKPRRADVRGPERERPAWLNGVTHTHGGLTPAALDCAPVGAQCLIFTLRRSYHHHGGLTPAALVDMRLCIAKIAKSVILPAHGRCNSARSGGRKPPVGEVSLPSARIAQIQLLSLASYQCSVRPVSFSSAKIAHLQRRPYMQPRAGGVSPPWQSSTGENPSATASVHATKSGGRKPPWNTLRMRTRNGQIHRIAVADAVCKPRRADVRGVGRKHSQLQRRYSHPRRADARRSCGYAFVHRKNRHSSGTRSS